MSVLSKAPRPSGDDVRRVALAALAAALDEGTQQQQKAPKRKGGLKSGVRTVAAGAALYVAGRAAYNNRDAILEQLQDGREQDDEDPVAEEDEDEEPVAEEDEDFDDDEEEEPVAEEDEDFDEDEEEEPVAEEDEDYDDEEEEEPVAEEDEDYDEDLDPVGRPPEPPESEDDEEHADAEPARR